MKPGRASDTAVMVCMGRALAHGVAPVAAFSDPTALALLPEVQRARVERHRAGVAPAGMRERLERPFQQVQSRVMALRTAAIDEAVRTAAHPQLVILGAGLDGRAWRMPELQEVVVFEVDHPDTQRTKRERAGSLKAASRDIRFVPVDFTRDSLEAALAAAGHDPARPTTWIWEGVVMYLTPAEVEASLAVVARRSAPGSRVVVLYHCPSLILNLVGVAVRWVGEPLRSVFTPASWAELARRHGFETVRDENLPDSAARLGPALSKEMRRVTHLRIATSDRVGSAG